ncbi:MAG: hypothetical protein SGPRY_006211, partial [Prymnesium sp.]
ELQAAILASIQSCRASTSTALFPSSGRRGSVGAAHLAAREQRQQRRHGSLPVPSLPEPSQRTTRLQREGILPAVGSVEPRKPAKPCSVHPPSTPSAPSSSKTKPRPLAGSRDAKRSSRESELLALPPPKQCGERGEGNPVNHGSGEGHLPTGGGGYEVSGMPADLPADAARIVERRCKTMGVGELAVPLGQGWVQRAGRGAFEPLEKERGVGVESRERGVFLLTQEGAESESVRGARYRVECDARPQWGSSPREAGYFALAFNWSRGRSSITSPCVCALAMSPSGWRLQQLCDGGQKTIAEVRDGTLKGGGLVKIVLEVRGDAVSGSVNGRALFSGITIPPIDSSSGKRLCGAVGVAVYKARVQLRRFAVSPLEEGRPTHPPYPGGDPKLVSAIEGEMLEDCPRVEWEAIGGAHAAKRLLNEAVRARDGLRRAAASDFFTGIREPWKGVLLFGPPGTGKTLLARAVASQCGTAFFNVSASSLVSKFHGESEKLARTLFDMARHHAPSVVFFDEVDALVSARGGAGEHEASRRLKSELLAQIDGVPSSGEAGLVMVLGTSNKPWDLDEAMRRRLERRIYIPMPDEAARKEMLAINTRQLRLAADVDLQQLAASSVGYSGADLHLVCRDAAMMTMRKAVEGRSPQEIVAMKEDGLLDGEVSADGKLRLHIFSWTYFDQAFQRTPPSVAADDLKSFAQWDAEFGSR